MLSIDMEGPSPMWVAPFLGWLFWAVKESQLSISLRVSKPDQKPRGSVLSWFLVLDSYSDFPFDRLDLEV